MSGNRSIKKVNGNEVIVSNLDKVYWPEEKYTKGDLIKYYEKISTFILPYLRGRPESLHRHPHGIDGNSFYQKDASDLNLPDWVGSKMIYSGSEKRKIKYLLCENPATLIYLANLGCIELNPWNSRKEKLEFPDYTVIDLDPHETDFKNVINVAKAAKKILDKIGVKGFVKTSGATGLHIYIPLKAEYGYDQARGFCHLINMAINRELPKITSLERSPEKRRGLVYLDYLQNIKGQTLASVYSVRPRAQAPVSAPLRWEELKTGLRPENFNIKNIFLRLNKYGDLWEGLLEENTDMSEALEKLQYLLK